jgi:transposase
MGKRKQRRRQTTMWIATNDLPRTAAHPFYERLNRILDDAGFDTFVESQCARFYADTLGRPSLTPGRYFRLLLVGYFEGLDSERAIAWRAADSFALREFLGLVLPEAPPDHSTISRTRRLMDLESHRAVFTWVLQRLADAGLVKGTTIGIDATTLEANAALRSIVRRDTGETYQEFLTQLAQASGIETPTRDDLARLDRKRKKKGSNDDWTHPDDPDAKITKMKDHRTHLAHKAEHAVDLETGAVVAVTVQDADAGDTTTSIETLIEAAEQVETVAPDGHGVQEVVGDKGYHSNQVMVDLEAIGLRSYISEPDRTAQLGGAPGGARPRLSQSSADSRGARQTAAPTPRRTSGTPLCASLRDRPDAPRAPAKA